MQWEAVQAALSRIAPSVVKAIGGYMGSGWQGTGVGASRRTIAWSIVAGPDWQQKNGEEWTEASRWIDGGEGGGEKKESRRSPGFWLELLDSSNVY